MAIDHRLLDLDLNEADAPRPSSRVRTLEPDSAARNRRTSPAALNSELRGDLDAIALKALEKDRRLRYDSPADLAADIGRYLRNQPVAARPASAAYIIRKYVRRHRASVAGAGSVFRHLAGGGIAPDPAERDRADRIAQFMTRMFRISDPGESRGNQVTARQILDKASADIGTGLASDPDVQAHLMNVMGRVLSEPRAVLAGRIAVTALNGNAPACSRRGACGYCPGHERSGNALSFLGRRAEAEQLDRQVLAIRRRRFGSEDPATLKSMNNLAVDMVQDGRYREAEELQQTVLQAERRTLGPENPSTLMSMANLGDTVSREGKYRDAEKLKRDALEIRRRLLGADHPDTLHALTQLATTLYDEGRHAEAEVLDREALDTRRRVLGPEHRDTLNAMIALANPLENEGRLAEAEKLDRSALQKLIKLLGPEHYDVLLAMITWQVFWPERATITTVLEKNNFV